jgi:hypothetical protein
MARIFRIALACYGFLFAFVPLNIGMAQNAGTSGAVIPADQEALINRVRTEVLGRVRQDIDAGGGYELVMIYAGKLWAFVPKNIPESDVDDIDKDYRIASGMFSLYAIELIRIGGEECDDRSAPSHRLDQLIWQQRPALLYLRSRSPELKAKVVDAVIALERKTALLRPHNNEMLCRGGMDEMGAAIEAGQQREVPTAPGYIGKTIELIAPPEWKPKFVPKEKYEPAQAEARTKMREYLLTIIK